MVANCYRDNVFEEHKREAAIAASLLLHDGSF
jgi:hypothetical protein